MLASGQPLRITGLSRLLWTLPLGAWLAIGLSCSPGEQPEGGSSTHPVLLLGVDGMEWNVLLPLIREGRMPNFAEVMARGTFGELETFSPTISTVIWTTIATGKVHQKHGIHHFAKRTGGELGLFDSRDRKTKALEAPPRA